ncbi:cytochrome c oxidase subunit II [Pseudonocardia sulfidoxydans NBRC 16205]|uniref:Cytochrome c oxidase subunit 2 n=2 Tax=Pseudonocardia sulfidoxydans TaxID=54011 RepID=A0A511DRT3_9PSEU|nr:cytochrome c oxidase subunit II [Pseudonocardia sulfidoxydans]GEL25768.1 cytochrome c oxidase subunit II [Pseudonocardia sulfidoxydans NBRC 16205]
MGRAQQEATGRRSGWRRAAKLAVLAAVVVPLTTGCSVDEVLRFGWPEGVTPQAHSMRTLWTWSAIAALIVGVITWGMMFWAVAFHRRKKGDDGTAPRQTQYNLPVEIVFTVIPTIIVAVLFGFTVNVQNYVDVKNDAPQERVEVTAFQWNWQFDVDDKQGGTVESLGTSSTIPILVLPTDRSIEFTIASKDVIHSFWVPEFLFKRDVFPMPEKNDTDNVFVVDKIEKTGAFVGRCAELCGSYHSQMNFEVRALPPNLYDAYMSLRTTNKDMTVAQALQQLQSQGCDAQLCAPQATTTYPFSTDRTLKSASEPQNS